MICLYCHNNPIKTLNYLISLEYITCDIPIDINKIHENRFNYGMTIIFKICKHKCVSKIKKN